MNPRSSFFGSQQLRLHYAEWGSLSAPPLLLVHGGRDHCRNWDWVAERFSGEWRVIAPDLRGHGDSEWCPSGIYTYDAYLWDLLALVEHLGIEKTSIIGHSLGGNIALRFAAAFPEKVHKFVCVEGLGISPSDVAKTFAKPYNDRLREGALSRQKLLMRPKQRFESIEHALNHYHSRNPSLTREQAIHLVSHGIRQNANGGYSWKFDDLSRKPSQTCASEIEVQQLIAAVQCPVLLPWGGRSFFSLEENQERISQFKNASVCLYSGSGHWPQHSNLDQFVMDTTRFLENKQGTKKPVFYRANRHDA